MIRCNIFDNFERKKSVEIFEVEIDNESQIYCNASPSKDKEF